MCEKSVYSSGVLEFQKAIIQCVTIPDPALGSEWVLHFAALALICLLSRPKLFICLFVQALVTVLIGCVSTSH